MKDKRIKVIDFWKFAFAVVIVAHHAGNFFNNGTEYICRSGFIAVEFYFIVSGYLLVSKSTKYNGGNLLDENIKMIEHKILQIFPYIFLACITANIFYLCCEEQGVEQISYNLFFSISDILGLQMLGYPTFTASGVSWYLSVLFMISFIIYPLLCKNRELFTKYIGPISSIFILGYILKMSDNLNGPGEWWGLTYKGLLRGYVDITAGCIAFEIKCYLEQKEIKEKFLIIFLEILGYVSTFAYAVFHLRSNEYDFIFIPLLMISVAISFSNKSVLAGIFKGKIYNWLGIFSLSIYLNHYYVAQNISKMFSGMDKYTMLLIYFFIVIVISLINHILGKKLASFTNTMKNVFIMLLLLMGIAQMICVFDYISIQCSYWKLGGRGTISSPYTIDNKEDLSLFRDLVNEGENFEGKYVLQTENINLESQDWVPIGLFNSGNYFKGIYDGGNHYIENLIVTAESTENGALFGALAGTVKNLGIESGSINGVCVGSIASHTSGNLTKIINCYNKASITGTERAGGICDNFTGGIIINCVNVGTVKAPIAAQILSYDAEKVESIYPIKNAISDTFTGKYTKVVMTGENVRELLNSGLMQLVESKVLDLKEVSLWNVN